MTPTQGPEPGDRAGDFAVTVLDLNGVATPKRLHYLKHALASLLYAVGAARVFALPPGEGEAFCLVGEGITPAMHDADPDAAAQTMADITATDLETADGAPMPVIGVARPPLSLTDVVIGMVEACRLYAIPGYRREDLALTPEQQDQLDALKAHWEAEEANDGTEA